MEQQSLVMGGLGAALGYVVGAKKADTASNVPVDVSSLQNQLSILQQQNDLYTAQIAALDALREIDQATGQAAEIARTSLQQQVSQLASSLANVQSTLFSGFPIVLGKGDPTLAGWIKGRDGLLISRPLANLVPTGTTLATTTSDNWTVDGTELSVSNILQSMPSRLVTIGRNMNTELHVNLPRGCDLNVAVVLNFEEDIGDDLDFIAGAHVQGLLNGHYVAVSPIGRKSIMLYVHGPYTYYSTEGYVSAWCNIKNGHSLKPSAYVSANKWSVNPSYRSRFVLSHRSARQLTLKSYHVVANPLFAENDSHCYLPGITAADLERLRPTVDSAQLQRITVGVNPRFLRINDTWNLVAQDVPGAQYLV